MKHLKGTKVIISLLAIVCILFTLCMAPMIRY